MLGWVWSFLAVWEAFSAPMGRWGTYAFPLVGTNTVAYVIDGQRVWRLERGSWQEVARLPEEIRAGVIWNGDTLLLGGLNGIYWGPLTRLQRLSLPGTGWAYRFWRSEQGSLLRSASGCTWLSFKEGQLSAEPLVGTCMGATLRSGLFGRQDSLYTWPEGQPLLPLRSRWTDILQFRDQLYGLNERGEVYALPQSNAVLSTGRTWVGTYLLTERNLLTWPDRKPLLRGDFPLYSASTDPAGELLVASQPQKPFSFILMPPCGG